MEYVAEAIPNELQNWKLTDIKSKTEMRDFFDRVSYRISFNGLLTKLVAPLDGDGVIEKIPKNPMEKKYFSRTTARL